MAEKFLVTGGAGFLGSHVCDRILARGDSVVCLDNFSTGSRCNVAHLIDHPGFEVVEQDVIDPVQVEVDAIFSLACPASPEQYQFDPIQTMKTSVLGTLNVLELAARLECRILQASTSEVYGDPIVHPQPESYWGNVNPIGERACYDEGKRCAETLFFDYHRQCGVDIRVARIFNTYGPRMRPDDGRVVSNFIVQALCGMPITIYGAGDHTRSFCYVDDMIEGLFRLMGHDDATGPVNLGNPVEFTIRELAETVIEITGSSSSLTFKALPQDDPKRRQPDISLAESLLNWAPEVALRDGLKHTIAYFDERLSRDGIPTGWLERIARPDGRAGIGVAP